MTEAEIERENLREDSEARDIIHDVNSLKNREEIQKTRWVWELLQNAKDSANSDGVDIEFELSTDKITITHNGMPFETKHLIAILHKKSTKSLGGDDGTTGKYGTGFVTTHVLSKKVLITGIHKDAGGERNFEIEIDRSSASSQETEALKLMKLSIKSTFEKINSISTRTAESIVNYRHTFTYSLNDHSRYFAQKGLVELEKNVIFTLLINNGDGGRKKIKSITIKKDDTSNRYEIEPKQSRVPGLSFLSSGNNTGLLYKEISNIVLGIPVEDLDGRYFLKSLENQAVLFKEFPLIGTENFNLPLFIQHNNFRPTEPRDGIVTKKEEEGKEEFIPDMNRICLLEIRDEYLSFLKAIMEAGIGNLHYLALSGLPIESKNYTGEDWYVYNIQEPLRRYINSKNILTTTSGRLIKIGEAKFPNLDFSNDNSFYKVTAALIPTKVADSYSIAFWDIVIKQQTENWPDNITISLTQLLENLPDIIKVDEAIPYHNLRAVYLYLQSINSTLGETYPIYLNERNEFKLRQEIKLYPIIDDEIKFISERLGRNLDSEFLNRKLGDGIPGIGPFDLEQFYKDLNNDVISKLDVYQATEDQVYAILHVNTLFRTDRAAKREKWLSIVKELLQEKLGEKKYVAVDYENFHQPAELWTAKYICSLIEKEVSMDQFAKIYFEENLEMAYVWLNNFLRYLDESRDDIKGFLTKYHIVPTQQDGLFKSYNEQLYKEDNPVYFDPDLKSLVKEYCKYNVEEHLISNKINVSGFRVTDIEFITKHIDKLFEDEKIASKVGINGELHNVFNTINSWFEKHSAASSYLKTFASKRHYLYVISLGNGFSQHIKALKDSGKSIEDITKLAEIKLSVEDMKRFETVAQELGPDALILKAHEMIAVRQQRLRWQKIGKSAEDAFKKVFEFVHMDMELYNPDLGKDFEIILKSKGYSIEIKNVIQGKESVRMSILQGRTAVVEKDRYALCVLTRPDDDTLIDEAYFADNAYFVTDIGYQIGDKIANWDSGLMHLSLSEGVKVQLDNKIESVYINRAIWKDAKPFSEFIEDLKVYFAQE